MVSNTLQYFEAVADWQLSTILNNINYVVVIDACIRWFISHVVHWSHKISEYIFL